MPEVVLDSEGGSLGVATALKGAGLTGSTSEAFRMIQQGAVRIDGERVADRDMSIQSGCTHVFQVGKRRFARITLR
jgi:tyrosyl-tRNA synthetase